MSTDPVAEKLVELLRLPAYERRRAFDDARSNPEFDAAAEMLRKYAVSDDPYAHRDQAEAWLAGVRAEVTLDPSSGPPAFTLLRDLRVFDEHENLAVHRFDISLEHPPERLAEADELAARGWDREGREDFTAWWTCTIDDASTGDIDDALSVQPRLGGGWELAVHIADPGAFIEVGTPFDEYIRERGTSIYLPTGVAPMLPEVLSEQAVSLVQAQPRPALTTVVVFDEDLLVVETRVVASIIEVNRRYSYEQVDALLTSEGRETFETQKMAELCYISDELHARRAEQGAEGIDLPRPTIKVEIEDGEPKTHVRVDGPSTARNIVAELMVMVGRMTAQWCHRRDIPLIYRGQERPDVERRDDQIQNIPQGWAREYALLRAMRRGEVDVVPRPHAALGIPMYAQVTSPIRRYADLVNQRQVKAAIAGQALPYDRAALRVLLEVVQKAAYEAGVVEEEGRGYWLLWHLQAMQGEELDAVILDAREGEADVELMLEDYAWRLRRPVRGRVAPGDAVRLRVERADPRAGTLTLTPV